MKWFRNPYYAGAFAAAGLVVVAARADLAEWVQNIEAGKPLEAVFFKPVTLGTVTVPARRPPAETRPELTKRIGAAPSDADLYSLRALEAEQQLDFASAESDWVRFSQLAKDPFAGHTALADFYQRRLEPAKELPALHAAAILPVAAAERFEPAPQQRSWKTFERILTVIDDQLFGFDIARKELQAWVARFPKEPAAYSRYVDYAVAHKQFAEAEQVAKQYSAAFPNDAVFPVRAQAQIEASRGSTQAALALYDRSFQPLWPQELVKSYFELLTKTGSLRSYLQSARANASELNGTSRVFYYWQQQGNLANAQRALMEFESRKKTWTAQELWTLSQLYETANNPDRAARCYYALYTLAGVSAADAERSLAGIANLLFTYADQAIRFGANDLSYYRDIAQADPYPGYLNGILSLILNTTEPSYRYSEANQHAQPYFHRARASELVALFDSRFPNSTERPALHLKRINAYSIHGDNPAVIRAGTQFRTTFPNAAERTEVATLMADAYARTNQLPAEFALYDELLQELAKRLDGVPLGEHASAPPAEKAEPNQAAKPAGRPRSPEYARILDRYIARLAGLKRIPDALALYRRELDRNPNDPGLYERFAGFLEQNRLGAQVEATYKRAIAQFPDQAWSHKLARWYLRQKQTTQLGTLTRDVTTRFAGTELEVYFKAVVPKGSLSAALYLQLNLYAHQRFPHNLAFTRNLLSAYQTRGTANPVAYEALLRANWFYADDLRTRFFEDLSRTKKLEPELAALAGINQPEQVNANPVAARMLADGEAWRTHFEAAAPVYRAITVSYPASSPTAERASAVYRSLATIDARNTEVAAGIEQNLVSYAPGNAAALTYDGEIYADRDRFDRARPVWNRIAAVRPGRADGYLESATIFWDYYLFDDALRVIAEGRRKLDNPALFAYQAGAIYENKRQYDQALAEYAKAAVLESGDVAERRLVRLARRPALRDSVERLTADTANRQDAPARALQLRAAVLENQGRRAELEQFLTASSARTSSLDTLQWVENQGRISGFAKVQEGAMDRRIAITSDPVDQARYRLALAHFYEDQSRTADAQRILSALYRDHPNILGVVRATTDFYWRSNQQKQAVATLTDAAGRAQPVYQRGFRLEAARKATEAGDTSTARQVLALLIKDDPYRSEYLTATADTYARAGDDAGLRSFYQTTIDSLRTSTLSAADKVERTAAMRRGLVPVLTRINDYTGALDQYIEILNRFPEDEQLTRDAASYAGAHQLGDRLVAYYTKTAAASPRDYRWPMVLGRVDTELEKFPEAIDAYAKATTIRPDRTDLWIAQAQLQERLLRFADAERNYSRLFELTYRNGSWMERVALVRARQSNKDGAVAALRAAYIDNRPERADNYFTVASRLNNWGYVDAARQLAEKGAEVAGAELMSAESTSATVYATIMGRARQYEAAYNRMVAGGADPEKSPALPSALHALGDVVRTYYTPEEKVAFAAFIDKQPSSQNTFSAFEAAGLEDRAVAWLVAGLGKTPGNAGLEGQLSDHQRRRLQFQQLGRQLEADWKLTPAQTENRDGLLVQAAEAYRQAGDTASELRVIRQKKTQSGIEGPVVARFCRLLSQQPQALVTVAGTDTAEDMRDMAANCAIENGRATDALTAITARGKGLPPVWTSAYTGLTGLFLAITTPEVRAAFASALGSPVIGDRVGKPADRDRQLVGEPWFYYGSRYGEYLAMQRQAESADYLPAMLEAAPGRATAYYDLADYYRQARDLPNALTNYRHSLELDAQQGIAHDRVAEVLWSSGRQDEAVAEWALALQAFNTRQDRGPVPPAFVEEVKATLTHIGAHNALAKLRPDADRLLKTYFKRNGTYMFEPLLEGVLAATPDATQGVNWLMELSQSMGDPMSAVARAVRHPALAASLRDALYRKLIDADQLKLSAAFGQPREAAESSLRSWQFEWLRSLVSRRETQRAQALLNSIPESARKRLWNETVPLEVQIAAQSNSIPALLARYAAGREPPPLDAIRDGANQLRKVGEDAAARRVLEFVYTRELQAHHFDSANFLGLAEIRLQEKQAPAAVELLKRMAMLSGEPFETLTLAGALLGRFGQTNEAAVFYDERVKAAPWDSEARAHLATLRKNTQELTAVASDSNTPYDSRIDSALALRRNGGATLSARAGELDLLASATPLAEAVVTKPYWYRSRVEASKAATDAAVKIRLLLAAIAINPTPVETRLDLFRAALDQKRNQLAIAAVPSQQEPAEPPPASEKLPEWMVSSFLQNTTFTQTDRTFFARGLGEAYQRMNEPARALYYYRLALELDRSPAQRAATEPLVKTLQQALELKQANESRRPVVSRNLEQPNIVRPRLTATRGGAQ